MRSQEQVAADQEQTRNRLLAAEAAALLLLSRRSKEATRGNSLAAMAGKLRLGLANGVLLSRSTARHGGLLRLADEAGLDVRLSDVTALEAGLDEWRAKRFADRFAADWFRRAEAAEVRTVQSAARAANASLNWRLQLAAATESADAFNRGRSRALSDVAIQADLLKVWDATLDRRTCPACRAADGEIVFSRERFPAGEPGSVHPRCRCIAQIIGLSERRLNSTK